jgi:CHAD domain-containing protein
MSNGKWITNLHATTPLADAARRVLSVRLEVVHDHLPLALHRWKEDTEHVHQLRVGTRRGGAALAIFRTCLPEKVFKGTRKHLRKLRRAAGAARDWDVFSQTLVDREKHVSVAQRPGLNFLFGYSQAQRVAAQETLEAVGAQAPFDFERLIAETTAAVDHANGQRKPRLLSDLARPWLSEIHDRLHAAASNNLDHYEHLHQVRILGKRLRYGMEVFASCFHSEFKEHYYPMVEEMQEILGQANDSHVACQRLTQLRDLLRLSQPVMWKRFRAGIESLLRYHQRRLKDQRRHFLRWWANWQKSGAEDAFREIVH